MAARPSGAATTVSAPCRRRRRANAGRPRAPCPASTGARPGQAGEQPREFALVRRQHQLRRPFSAGRDEQRGRMILEGGDAVGVEHQPFDALSRAISVAEHGQCKIARLLADAETGAEHEGGRAAVVRTAARAAASSTLRSMIDVRCAALTCMALPGDSTVTAPAPPRAAAMADRRAAPVEDGPPEKTFTWPRLYLWVSAAGRGKPASHRVGPFSKVLIPSPQRRRRRCRCRPARPRHIAHGRATAGGPASCARR